MGRGIILGGRGRMKLGPGGGGVSEGKTGKREEEEEEVKARKPPSLKFTKVSPE